MTHYEINQEFTRLYPILHLYTKKALSVLQVKLTPEEILSDCFIHVYHVHLDIDHYSNMESVAKHWIKSNLNWDSPIKRQLLHKDSERLENTILLETRYLDIDKQEFITRWESTLSRDERNLWNLWYHKELKTAPLISKHLNISNHHALQVLHKCRKVILKLKNKITHDLHY